MKKIIAGIMAVALVFGTAAFLPAQNGAFVKASADEYSIDDLQQQYEENMLMAQQEEAMLFNDTELNASVDAVSGNYEYAELSDGTIELTKYNGSETNITLPTTINGKKVTRVGKYAFQFNRTLVSVTVPEGYTSLENHAFFCVYSLDVINLPSTLTHVGGSCFWGCKSLRKCHVPDSVTQFDDLVFSQCENLVDVVLPAGLEELPGYTFNKCTKMRKLIVADNVKFIRANAVTDCDSMHTLIIPAGTQLDDYSVGLSQRMNSDNTFSYVPTPGLTIYGEPNSPAEAYAKKFNIPFKSMSELPKGTPGDVNFDGKINAVDITKIAAHIKGLKTLDTDGAAMADVNNDGKVNAADISKIAAHIKGLKLL